MVELGVTTAASSRIWPCQAMQHTERIKAVRPAAARPSGAEKARCVDSWGGRRGGGEGRLGAGEMEAAHGLETPDKGRTTDSLVEVRLCRLGSVLAMVAQPAADGAVLEATEEGATYHGDLVGGGLNHGR